MAVIATDTARFSALVKHEYEPSLSYCRDVDATNAALGTVIYDAGKAVGVAIGDGLKLTRGPVIVSEAALILGAGVLATVKAELKALGILVEAAA